MTNSVKKERSEASLKAVLIKQRQMAGYEKKKITVFISIIAICIFFATSVSIDNPETIKVFLLGGQSNMVGLGQIADLEQRYLKPLDKIKIWNMETGKWEVLYPGCLTESKSTFGPEISFGYTIAGVLPAGDIRLVKYAVNGTALYNDWAPAVGPQYLGFMKTAKTALADIIASGTDYEIAGMLWLQGESDADENQADTYEKNLAAFIAHIRNEFKTPEMKFVIARVLAHYGGNTGQAAIVRDAQATLAESMDHVTWFDTDDCPRLNAGHYNSKGLIEIGKRFAESFSADRAAEPL